MFARCSLTGKACTLDPKEVGERAIWTPHVFVSGQDGGKTATMMVSGHRLTIEESGRIILSMPGHEGDGTVIATVNPSVLLGLRRTDALGSFGVPDDVTGGYNF